MQFLGRIRAPHSTNNRQPVIAVAVALVAVVVVFVAARLTVVVVMAFSVGGVAIALVAGIAVVIVVTAAAVTIVRTIQANSIFQCFSLTLCDYHKSLGAKAGPNGSEDLHFFPQTKNSI